MPPKRKGKIRVFPPLPLPSPIQQEISRFLLSPALNEEKTKDSVEPPSQGGLSVPLDEASLSPNIGVPPAQRLVEISSEGAEAETISEGVSATLGAIPRTGERVEFLEIVTPLNGNNEPTTQASSPGLPARPAVITLEALWGMMEGMFTNIKGLERKVDTLITGSQQDTLQTQKQIKELTDRTKELENYQKKNVEFHVAVVKDREVISKRLESLENRAKKYNLRFLNFPRVIGELTSITLKKFLIELLGTVLGEKISIVNCYFIPKKSDPNNRSGQIFQGDLTNFLESSAQIIDWGSLLVNFSSLSDINLIMKNYFQKYPVQFMDKPIKIFPDLAYSTQVRRKAFLVMRQEVLDLTYTFTLRFPCKCVLRKENDVFIFFLPE
ncbi:uncharacterized protein LOC115076583 [Rhinatrema bivittatum]|uniref:uncharacterized protein LOC115076583 n=1 Tax=Rhinatrema bivittatum TaxID=194408 RepID=UPI00112D0ECF|nr:uncharacterized protein LOC115076583 [Rhinatrema bivittatum]XP_029434044.1 uncharacterized protein LOC115076583 [Rhinatrema bivittatum]